MVAGDSAVRWFTVFEKGRQFKQDFPIRGIQSSRLAEMLGCLRKPVLSCLRVRPAKLRCRRFRVQLSGHLITLFGLAEISGLEKRLRKIELWSILFRLLRHRAL